MADLNKLAEELSGLTVLEAAAARIEQYHGNKPIPKHVGKLLGRIASEAIADLDRTETVSRLHIAEALSFRRIAPRA